MQTSTTQTVTKQQCDTCYRDVEVHSETTRLMEANSNSCYSSNSELKRIYQYPIEGVAPRFFRVQVSPDSLSSHPPLYLELCDECVRELTQNKYEAPDNKPQEWFDEVMEELRPSKMEESEPVHDNLRPSVADETESEIHDAEAASDPGDF